MPGRGPRLRAPTPHTASANNRDGSATESSESAAELFVSLAGVGVRGFEPPFDHILGELRRGGLVSYSGRSGVFLRSSKRETICSAVGAQWCRTSGPAHGLEAMLGRERDRRRQGGARWAGVFDGGSDVTSPNSKSSARNRASTVRQVSRIAVASSSSTGLAKNPAFRTGLGYVSLNSAVSAFGLRTYALERARIQPARISASTAASGR
jgi:hypothetical protein